MAAILQNEFGKVVVAKNVIAIIAGHAAFECYGLVGMASQKVQDGIAELLGKEAVRKGIVVSTSQDRLVIDAYIIVGYATKISEVANNVMEKIRYTVENATGIKVDKVNIIVQGVKVMD